MTKKQQREAQAKWQILKPKIHEARRMRELRSICKGDPEYISQMERAKELYKKPPEEPGSASCEVELIQTSATLLDSGSSSSMISATREGEPALPRIKDGEVWLQELLEAQGEIRFPQQSEARFSSSAVKCRSWRRGQGPPGKRWAGLTKNEWLPRVLTQSSSMVLPTLLSRTIIRYLKPEML